MWADNHVWSASETASGPARAIMFRARSWSSLTGRLVTGRSFQPGFERAQAAVDAGFDGAQRHLCQGGDFVERHAFLKTKHERLPIFRGQMLHAGLDVLVLLALQSFIEGRGLSGCWDIEGSLAVV